MFDVFIIDCRRHCFQNAIKLQKLFKEFFDSVYLLSSIDVNNRDKNLISIGDYDFVNGFNQALRVVKNKFSIFVNSSLDINDLRVVLYRLNYLKENLFDYCGSYGFSVQGFNLKEEQKKEIYPKLYQVTHHSLDFFVLEKSIFKAIGLLPCVPYAKGEGLEYLIPWISTKNNKSTFLDEIFVFKNRIKIKKNKLDYIVDKQKCFLATVSNVYNLNNNFELFYKTNFNYI